MEEHSEYSFRNNLVSNIKYWLLGSFISLNVGWAVLIIVCILIHSNKLEYCSITDYFFYIIVCFGPFVGVLILKLIKRDIPWYFYITTGLIYGITFLCFINCVDKLINDIYNSGIKIALSNLSLLTLNRESIVQSLPDYNIIFYVMIAILISSLLGGFTVDIYRYFKGRNSERNYL